MAEFVIRDSFLQLNWFSTSLSLCGVVSSVFVKLILLSYFSGYGFCISPIPVINLFFFSPLGFTIFFKRVKDPSFSVFSLRIFLENVCDLWTLISPHPVIPVKKGFIIGNILKLFPVKKGFINYFIIVSYAISPQKNACWLTFKLRQHIFRWSLILFFPTGDGDSQLIK